MKRVGKLVTYVCDDEIPEGNCGSDIRSSKRNGEALGF